MEKMGMQDFLLSGFDFISILRDEQKDTVKFLRKFISYAKKMNSILTSQACEYISEKYAGLRAFEETQLDKEWTMPMTARMLETLTRLSTAFAKIRFAKRVTASDAEKAYSMLIYAIF
uniref:MCM_lid domain-containing protein n=1 Tax=Trichuris muris TaxID=70415 RepID=A0A5S6QAH6_TRIMR